jgi:hypothetical protein
MGRSLRKKSGNLFAGSKLNVPGQGIYTVKAFTGYKLQVDEQKNRVPRPSQTPSNTPTPTPTITPSITPTPTITPSITPTITPSITPTPTETPKCITYKLTLKDVKISTFTFDGCCSSAGEKFIVIRGPSFICSITPPVLSSGDGESSPSGICPCITPTPTPTITTTPTPTPTDTGNYLLQSNGFFVLQSDGSKIIIT